MLKKVKKGLSVSLAVVFTVLCFFSVPVFAAEPVFDIRDYTIEDLQTMSTAEKQELLANFIDTYNPYGIKELMKQAETANNTASLMLGITPYWKSDSDSSESGQQMATHQLITLEALSVFIADFGFYQTDGTTALVIALNLAAASGLPDLLETDALTFSGHFYDPDTGKNWTGTTLPTAKTRAQSHYNSAKTALSRETTPDLLGDNFETTLEQLGKALHYMQDVCEPHHAANQTALNSTHTDFELYVDLRINSLMPSVSSISNGFYEYSRQKSAGELAHQASTTGKAVVSYTTEEHREDWSTVGTYCLENAIWHSARLIYKLFYEANASFLN